MMKFVLRLIVRLFSRIIRIQRDNNLIIKTIKRKKSLMKVDVSKIITGLPYFDSNNSRLEQAVMKSSAGNKNLIYNSLCLSGGALEFITDTSALLIEITVSDFFEIEYLTKYSLVGVEVLEYNCEGEEMGSACFTPKNLFRNKIRIEIENEKKKSKRFKVYLPTFIPTSRIELYVTKDATITAVDYDDKHTIAIYGSSITQGCSASKPSMSYSNQISKNLGCQVYNFGFSESAKGDPLIAIALSKLDVSIIVLEYDHNSSIEELSRNHYTFYEEIRANNKKVNIILLSRLSGGLSISQAESLERREIIINTFNKAINSGDDFIHFIDGDILLDKQIKSDYFVDNVHPNDLGMKVIAQSIISIVRSIWMGSEYI